MLQMKTDELESLRMVLKYLEGERRLHVEGDHRAYLNLDVWLHVDHLQAYLDYEADLEHTHREKS